ncbi:MAG: GNAT family N-acetyltransferase [Clostridia bacterium]|nr:GNAT family N-acetyltransferase [Clostridia bacterium]
MTFEITDELNPKDVSDIRNGLLEYNIPRLEDKEPRELGIYHRVNGKIKAGLTGETHGNWLEVEYLWVSEELRGKGIGSSILKKSEEIARERGCRYVFLNTFGFQAPKFYEKYGYKEVFTMQNFPKTGTKHFYMKELT